MNKKIMLAGLATLALSVASQAAVRFVGTTGGTVSSIIDLAIPSVDGVSYAGNIAGFEAVAGGTYTDALSAANGVPTLQWGGGDQIVLEDIVAISNGNLIIDAGTIVRGQPRTNSGTFDPGALLITAGSKIIAAGESTNPIVFTTASTSGAATGGRAINGVTTEANFWDQPGVLAPKSAETAGLWGGVLVLGKAPTNVDRDAGMGASSGATLNAVGTTLKGTVDQVIFGYGSGVNKNEFSGSYTDGTTYGVPTPLTTTATTDDRSSIEGIPATASVFTTGLDRFGGFDADDNSGIIKYASIRHGGANLAANNEINGLTCGAVGRGTTLSYIEVYGNTDDGFEFFGGNVNADHLVVIAQQDDGLDFDVGYNGTVQFALVVGGAASDKLVEWDGNYELETVNGFAIAGATTVNKTPVGNFAVYNATLIGNLVSGNHGLNLRDGSAPRLVNSIIANPKTSVVDVDVRASVPLQRNTTEHFRSGLAEFVGVTMYRPANVSPAATALTTLAQWITGGGNDAIVRDAVSNVLNPGRANLYDSNSDSNPGLGALPTVALTGGQLVDVVPDSGAASPTALAAVLDDGTFAANASISFAPYRGAYQADTTELWTSGWSAAALASIIVQ